MFPTVGSLLGVELAIPTHDLFVALGVLAALVVLAAQARRAGVTDERLLYVVTGGLVGGALAMRLGTWMPAPGLSDNASLAEHWVQGSRSILGGLVGAWLGVHVAKRLSGYRARTGDLFAPAVALGMAVGRTGCLLTETPGRPTALGVGPVLDADTAERLGAAAGVPLHPSFAYEMVFHLVAFAVLWWVLRDRLTAPGESLVVYLAAYGVFRFLVEFVRANDVVWQGLTRPQLFLLLTVPLLLVRVTRQWRRGAYALGPRQAQHPRRDRQVHLARAGS